MLRTIRGTIHYWRGVTTLVRCTKATVCRRNGRILLFKTLGPVPRDTSGLTDSCLINYHTSSVFNGKIVPFILSDIGEGIAEVQVKEWFIKEGDVVKQFDNVCEVQSDKAAVVITSRYDGVVRKVHYEVDDIAKVGQPLVDIEVEEEEGDTTSMGEQSGPSVVQNEVQATTVAQPAIPPASATAATTSRKPQATPAVRRIASEHNVDISKVTGTGKDGRILKEDVMRYLDMIEAPPPAPSTPVAAPSTSTPIAKVTILTEDKVVPVKGYKRTMVRTMTQSGEIPQFGYCDEINMNAIVKLRQQVKEDLSQRGMNFTYMPLLIKALSHALSSYPMLNAIAAADASSIIYKASHNIGVAVDTQDGLVVPNIKSVQTKSVIEVSDELNRLTELAHQGKLGPSDISGGTFSLSNIGAVGGTYARPMLLPPEVAIGAFGKIQLLPRYMEEGELRPSHVMHVSWSADHRLVDGATMARFSNLWKSFVENPARLMLELK